MKTQLRGMFAALITAMEDDQSFSPERQAKVTEAVLGQGLDGLYVGGSSGESGLLSTTELLDQQQVVAEVVPQGQGTLIAHVGAPNLRDSIALAQNAERLGFHGLSALPPHAYPFTDGEIINYYRALSAATALPMIVYEVPVRTNRPLPFEVLSSILQLPNVAGIKFTSQDLFKFSQLKAAHPDKIFYFGFDEIYLSAGALGAHGGIGSTYNVMGKLYAELNRAISAGDLAGAQQLQDVSQQFVGELLEMGVLPGIKAILQARGLNAGPTRAPLCALSDKVTQIAQRMANDSRFAPWLIDHC
ncbi:dihydrodipicolinate synthase family protein [Maritalea mediterranea]|uniref:Dihydrodipicolinate synthase family protein n=1 Tax=Maritalea mediterranea TaxID=2909667 RepID=A0ABS9E671_9HYPH|nr:dihydrodipicolinate synthase family protein [Maritalea mediterranea]MCF4097275.1 dihydrodipicolinate synthase family protein [Maritalea mediterranea]